MNSSVAPVEVIPAEPGPSPRLNWGRWGVFVVVFLGLILFLAYGPDEKTVIEQSGQWRAAARHHLVEAVAIFFVVEVILVGFSIPVGFWLTVLAGFLFGTWLGTIVVNFAATAGAVLAFLAARYVFADALNRATQSRPRLGRWQAAIHRGFQAHSAYYVFLLRLTPVIPFWVLNIGLALTPVRVKDYWWATQLGMLPITLVVCHAGASLAEITTFRDILSINVLLAFGLLPLVPFAIHQFLSLKFKV